MKKILKLDWGLMASAAFALSILAGAVSMAQQSANDAQIAEIRSALRSAKYQNALNKVSDILAKNPTNVTSWCLKGEVHARLNETSAALESFDKAIKIKKTSICAVVGKANALGMLKKEAESSGLLGQAVSMNLPPPRIFCHAGQRSRA